MEFKRHKAPGMNSSKSDVERLKSFKLNDSLKLSQCGEEPLKVLSECKAAYALVAGLKWYKRKPKFLKGQVVDRIGALNGQVNFLSTYDYTGPELPGNYCLQYGYFLKDII